MDKRGEERGRFSNGRAFERNSEKKRGTEASGAFQRFEPGENREKGRDFPQEERRDGARRPSRGDLGAIMDIDADILHLIARRSHLLSRLSSGGRLASEKEKILRLAWESKAARLSRDSRLSRDFFVLLQSIEILSRAEEEQGGYNLAPSFEAVDIRLPAPTDLMAARCWLALAAASGQKLMVERLPLTNAVVSAIKALNQMGGQIGWDDDGVIQSRGGSGLTRNMDKVIHIGDDAFNFWLVLAFSAGMPTRLKITGENSLRFLNLAPVRHFLPQLGVRLTNVIPSQDGLPVRIECSGLTPPEVTLPDDIPEDFAAALVLASAFWEHPCRIVFSERAPRLLPLVLSILEVSGAAVRYEEGAVKVERGTLSLPEKPVIPVDPMVAAVLLMLPGFNGGRVELSGGWGHFRAHGLVEKMLQDAGLDVAYAADSVVCSGKSRATAAPTAADLAAILEVCPELLPLAALITAAAVCEGEKTGMPELSGEDRHLFTAFSAVCGVEERDGVLVCGGKDAPGFWVAPSASWAMAYALAAFLRPNIRLSNPGIVFGRFPSFWKIYNALPCPDLTGRERQETEDVRPARRRVIAQGVYGELPPEPPAGDDF